MTIGDRIFERLKQINMTHEDITEILVNHVSTGIRKELQSLSIQPAAKAFEKMRNEVPEYFIKLRKQPEKVEAFIEQAYWETETSDFAVITERVYDLV